MLKRKEKKKLILVGVFVKEMLMRKWRNEEFNGKLTIHKNNMLIIIDKIRCIHK